MSAHIIGRPNDDLLDVMLGHGADPERALIRGSEQGREEGDGFRDRDRAPGPSPPMRASSNDIGGEPNRWRARTVIESQSHR
jgi:hypothetical protein